MAIATFDLSKFFGQAALALNRSEIDDKKSRIKETGYVTMDGNGKWEGQKPYIDSPLPVSGTEQRGLMDDGGYVLALTLVKSE